jgi:hypothetical protein
MSTTSPESPARGRRGNRAGRWVTPAFALVLGVFFFVVAVVQDDWGGAWFSLGLFTGTPGHRERQATEPPSRPQVTWPKHDPARLRLPA